MVLEHGFRFSPGIAERLQRHLASGTCGSAPVLLQAFGSCARRSALEHNAAAPLLIRLWGRLPRRPKLLQAELRTALGSGGASPSERRIYSAWRDACGYKRTRLCAVPDRDAFRRGVCRQSAFCRRKEALFGLITAVLRSAVHYRDKICSNEHLFEKLKAHCLMPTRFFSMSLPSGAGRRVGVLEP